MEIKYNDLPDVNEYINKHSLIPNYDEDLMGHGYNKINDITYLVVINGNTYTSFNFIYYANEYAKLLNGTVVVCKGEIKDE